MTEGFDKDGLFIRRCCRLILGWGSADEIGVYCRLSHRATFTWVAMTHIFGFGNVKIYGGSWIEWGSIVGFPVEK